MIILGLYYVCKRKMNGQKFYKIDNHPLRFRVNLTDSFTLIIITNQPTAKGEQRRAKLLYDRIFTMPKNKYACKLVGIVTIELLLDKLASYSSRFCTRWNRKTVQPHLCTGVLMNNGSAVLFHELACEHNVPV